MKREIEWHKGEAIGGKPLSRETIRSGSTIVYIHESGVIHTAKVYTCMVDINKLGADLCCPDSGQFPHPQHHYPREIKWWAKIGKGQKP